MWEITISYEDNENMYMVILGSTDGLYYYIADYG